MAAEKAGGLNAAQVDYEVRYLAYFLDKLGSGKIEGSDGRPLGVMGNTEPYKTLFQGAYKDFGASFDPNDAGNWKLVNDKFATGADGTTTVSDQKLKADYARKLIDELDDKGYIDAKTEDVADKALAKGGVDGTNVAIIIAMTKASDPVGIDTSGKRVGGDMSGSLAFAEGDNKGGTATLNELIDGLDGTQGEAQKGQLPATLTDVDPTKDKRVLAAMGKAIRDVLADPKVQSVLRANGIGEIVLRQIPSAVDVIGVLLVVVGVAVHKPSDQGT